MEVALDQVQWHDRDGNRVSYEDVLHGIGFGRPGTGILAGARRVARGLRDLVVWASGKSNTQISKLLNAEFNGATYSSPATVWAAIWTGTLNAASTGSTAGEASYTSYARVSITANTTNFPTSTAGAAITNGTAITFPANTGTLQTGTFFAILDASTAGNILYWGSITSTAINPGDTPQVAPSGLTVTEA